MESLLSKPNFEVASALCKSQPWIRQLMVTTFCDSNYFVDGAQEIEPVSAVAVVESPGKAFFGETWDYYGTVFMRRRNGGLGLTSIAICDEMIRHIPMLDFDQGNDNKSIADLIEILRKCELPSGVILNSGRGLHYMGLVLMTQGEMFEMIERVGKKEEKP